MIILIPLGGFGSRFKKQGYKLPKALINVSGKPIIFWLLDNIKFNNKIDFIYIPYNKEYQKYNFEDLLKNKYKNIKFKFLCLENNTGGAAETVLLALNQIISENIKYPKSYDQMRKHIDKPILCLDCDNFYLNDIISEWNGSNSVFTILDKSLDEKYSYVKLKKGSIIDIIEKVKISNNACSGAYGFDSFFKLLDFCNKVIKNNIKSKGEFYISTVIKQYLNSGIDFKNIHIDSKNYFCLGTPDEVEKFKISLLLDLDGTLVNTDFIYLKVWIKILSKYNLKIDNNFFKNFIKGNSDYKFLKYLIPKITDSEIKNISIEKDQLFIKLLSEIDDINEIIFENVLDFLEKNKNRFIAIVTSSNKKSAEFLINKLKIKNYINLLISSEDTKKHKPSSEPYLKAINLLNLQKENCIIFEDSISGYISAKNLNCFDIFLKINEDSKNETKNLNVKKFNNYKQVNLKNIINNKSYEKNYKIIEIIKEKISYLPIKDIIFNDIKLKTGYICDIDSYEIILNNNEKINIVIKISNFDNELSNTAIKLDLYKNESYFYDKIARTLYGINTPKSMGIFKINNKDAIILENLKVYNGKFNINLSNNINLLLKILNDMGKIHSIYHFKSEDKILNNMKELKKVKQITYYSDLIKKRYDKFIEKNNLFLSSNQIKLLNNIYKNFDNILDKLSSFPLSFCHGDLKSPNIFYKDNSIPYYLDWQYIHLNKGVSDIIFLLVESIEYNQITTKIVEKYYYKVLIENNLKYTYSEYINDLKLSLCIFPFFVSVWFNSEDSDKLLDKVFPLRFMKNMLEYYDHYLDEQFFENM